MLPGKRLAHVNFKSHLVQKYVDFLLDEDIQPTEVGPGSVVGLLGRERGEWAGETAPSLDHME